MSGAGSAVPGGGAPAGGGAGRGMGLPHAASETMAIRTQKPVAVRMILMISP